MNNYSNFLKDAEKLNQQYASIFVNCELESLVMPFWSWQEIKDGLNLRKDWEVDVSLTPFCGDWHELFCLNESTGEIIILDDNRQQVCRWDSIDAFMRCLSIKEVEYDDGAQFLPTSHFPELMKIH